ncbi:MAG: hypothetical protein QM527_07075 [Alphaproteobacteria bacterium]|nr:hypothetical protein [Alphaproteobacteria bacterium]
MVRVIPESEVRQEMILLRRHHELDRFLQIDWPELLQQIRRYGLAVQLDLCFMRSGPELQLRVTCHCGGQTHGYCLVLNHPDCRFLLREAQFNANIMSARNLGQILFDKIYNQHRGGGRPQRASGEGIGQAA